ncbi:hypothetical protein [Micromonospora globbae]|uniref:hypothetical protein n=1 Tax=Micromonospora globbae TaxID=1894969 RepID=UPI00341E189C
MVLPMALRRWLPAVLLLAALGCAIAPMQRPQPLGGSHAAAGSSLGLPRPDTVDAGKPVAQPSQSHASIPSAEHAAVDAILALTHAQSVGCGEETWAALDVAYQGANAAPLSAALSPLGDAPPPGAIDRLDLDSSTACPVGLLLADLAVLRT